MGAWRVGSWKTRHLARTTTVTMLESGILAEIGLWTDIKVALGLHTTGDYIHFVSLIMAGTIIGRSSLPM